MDDVDNDDNNKKNLLYFVINFYYSKTFGT